MKSSVEGLPREVFGGMGAAAPMKRSATAVEVCVQIGADRVRLGGVEGGLAARPDDRSALGVPSILADVRAVA